MNIRMAAVAACALTLGSTPAAAALFTVETTFTGTPNVVQVGETVVLHLTVTLVPNLEAAVIVFGMAFPGLLSVTDGTLPLFAGDSPHSRQPFFQLTANIPFDYAAAVSYQTPGSYVPLFQGSGIVSYESVSGGAIQRLGFAINGSTSVSVVPAPAVGAGLPGLVLAFGGALAWWRRRYPKRIQFVPFHHTLMC